MLHAPAFLLLVVQTSIVLFTIGLVYLLWSIDHAAARPAIIIAGTSGALLYLANLMPFLQSLVGAMIPATLSVPQCPYKSPTSWLLHSACVLLNFPWIIVVRGFIRWTWGDGVAQRVSYWCHDLGGLLSYYPWQWYDGLCRNVREWWGPQNGRWPYSHYLVRGTASAIEALVSKSDAMETIPSCIQVLQQQFRDAETWEKLFNTKLSRMEKALLEDKVSLRSGDEDEGTEDQTILVTRTKNLRRDFLSAHFFQHLVAHSEKIGRILHQHRIELYIRIKNSSQDVTIVEDHVAPEHRSDTSRDSDNNNGPVGSSLDCPVLRGENAQDMSQGEAKH